MATAAGESAGESRGVFICSSQHFEDLKVAEALTVSLRNHHNVHVVCPGVTEEWGGTAHQTASKGLQNYAVAVVVASRVLFEDHSSSNTAAKSCLDALFEKATDKVLMLRRNMTAQQLAQASPLGHGKSVDWDTNTEDVAQWIYSKVREVSATEQETDDLLHFNPREEFGYRQPTVDSEATNGQVYRYDAFICFNSQVEKWVKRDLVEELEHQTVGLKVCVHYRDFRPGKTIINNIIDSIHNSRNIVFVVSDGFSSSGWCTFEMAAAMTFILRNAKGKDQKIVPILYSEGVEVPAALTLYPPLKKEDDEFWSKLKRELTRGSTFH